MPITSVWKNKYAMIYTDDWAHWSDVSLFAKKSDDSRAFNLYKTKAQKFHFKRGFRLTAFQRDWGEFTSNDFIYELAL